MIRSLRTGVSGLLSHQNKLDVVSNNIANANTVAFKRSRVAFTEMLAQELMGVGRQGGEHSNPAYIGNGVAVSSIDKNWQQGAFEFTDIRTDRALNGDGFFLTQKNGRNVLTRAGNFTFSPDGQLVTAGGLPVLGYGVDANGDIDTSSLQGIQLDREARDAPQFTDFVEIAGNLSADTPQWTPVDSDGDGEITALDAPGDSRTTVSTAIYDEQGQAHNLLVTFAKTDSGPNDWMWAVEDPGGVLNDPNPMPNDIVAQGTLQFDVSGNGLTLNTPAPPPGTIEGPIADFDGDGTIDGPQLNWNPDFVTGGPTIDVNLSAGLTQYGGSTTAIVRDQNGYPAGELSSYEFDNKGRLVLSFTNGQKRFAGQLAIGTVNNPQGLDQLGENLYGESLQSGSLSIGRAGDEIDAVVVGGALEQSNVDLATEFADMITSQRGYQASSRIITTSDEVLQTLIQMKR